MDYYKCENCGKMFDEFEMNYRAAQVDKKCWCRACRESAQQSVHTDAPKPFVNHCNPVNGVHAPFCNGDHSARW